MAKYEKPIIVVNMFLDRDVLTDSNEQSSATTFYDNLGSWSWGNWQKN